MRSLTLLAMLGLFGCASAQLDLASDLTYLGPIGPPGRAGCRPSSSDEAPPAGFRAIAIDRVECPEPRAQCLEQMRADACKLGGDAIFGLHPVKGLAGGEPSLVGTIGALSP
ncbi:MAG: hypothetical protein ACYCWW_13780 [Deltaproteobacteria bacterium]